jgi:hypothetical protein
MRTACFARAPQRCTSRLSKHFLLTFQEDTPLRKTRNQLIHRLSRNVNFAGRILKWEKLHTSRTDPNKHGNIVWCTHCAREAFCDINHAHLPPPERYLHLASEDVMRACKEPGEVESKTIRSVVSYRRVIVRCPRLFLAHQCRSRGDQRCKGCGYAWFFV